MPTPELERAAYHEAGHAVVALAQGRAVLEMRIEESPTVWGMARYDDSPQPDELDFRSGAIRQVLNLLFRLGNFPCFRPFMFLVLRHPIGFAGCYSTLPLKLAISPYLSGQSRAIQTVLPSKGLPCG